MTDLLKNSHLCCSDALLYTPDNVKTVDRKIKSMSEKDTYTIIHRYGFTEVIKVPFGTFFGTTPIPLVSNSLNIFVGINEWSIPKPKLHDLETLISLDKRVYQEHKSEFFCSLCWNIRTKKYEIFVPNQSVNAASVSFNQILPQHLVQVIDHHSHNTMGAFFSGVDDSNDALRFKISMVVGKLDSMTPDIKMRLILSGKVFDLQPNLVFEGMQTVDVEGLYETYVAGKLKVKQKVMLPQNKFGGFVKSRTGGLKFTEDMFPKYYDEEEKDMYETLFGTEDDDVPPENFIQVP